MTSRRDSQEIIDLDLDYSQAQLSRSPGITGKTQNPVSKQMLPLRFWGMPDPHPDCLVVVLRGEERPQIRSEETVKETANTQTAFHRPNF